MMLAEGIAEQVAQDIQEMAPEARERMLQFVNAVSLTVNRWNGNFDNTTPNQMQRNMVTLQERLEPVTDLIKA